MKIIIKLLTILPILLLTINLSGQPIKKLLEKVETYQDVRDLSDRDDLDIKNGSVNTGNQKLEPWEALIAKKPSQAIFKINNSWYKIMEKKDYTASSVRCIYFNGNDLDYTKLDSLRDLVIGLYEADKNEKNFAALANEYTMDGNRSGGLFRWYDPALMVETFSEEVVKHKKDDIFKIDIPDRQWFYVVLKLADEQAVTNTSFIKITKK